MNNQIINEDVIFTTKKSHLTEKEIDDIIPYFFEGKEYFIQFYLNYNGMIFPNIAFFYRDLFYEVSKDEYNLLSIEAFFAINNSNSTIFSIWNAVKENNRVKMFANYHIPFAINSSGDIFWIELPTGKIKYICMETPDNIILVAPSFIDFCRGIQANIR